MERFKKILVYTGGEADPAPGLQEAADLAIANGAALKLIDVLPETTEGPWVAVEGRPELEQIAISYRNQDLEEMTAPLRERGLAVTFEVTTGSPFVEIIRRVVEDGHDLVVKTAQGLEARVGGLLGTTALHLMRKCPCPVWVVKPASGEVFGRVLAAVDPQPDKDEAMDLAARVVELAAAMAEKRAAELHVVHAWWLPAEETLRGGRIRLSEEKVEGYLREVQAVARKGLDALLAGLDLGALEPHVHLVKGIPFEVLRQASAGADLTVLGTISRGGVEGLLIGNTAERVLRGIDCSVLAVKPWGFQTPLRF